MNLENIKNRNVEQKLTFGQYEQAGNKERESTKKRERKKKKRGLRRHSKTELQNICNSLAKPKAVAGWVAALL